jgi:hypothetical protein
MFFGLQAVKNEFGVTTVMTKTQLVGHYLQRLFGKVSFEQVSEIVKNVGALYEELP